MITEDLTNVPETQKVASNPAVGIAFNKLMIPTPSVSQTQDASSINNQMSGGSNSSISFPNPPSKDPSSANGLNTSVPNPTIASVTADAQTQTPTDTKQAGILGRIAELVRGKQSLASVQNQNENAAGVPALAGVVNDLGSQLEGLNNQALALQNESQYTIPNQQMLRESGGNVEAAMSGRPQTKDALLRNQIKQGAIATQALTLKSAIYAAQGKYTLAKDAADKAAQITFDATEQEINYQKALLDQLAPQLTKQEKVQAAVLQANLDEASKKAEYVRADTVAGLGLINTALANYQNDPKVAYAVSEAHKLDTKDPNYLANVNALVGQYQKDPNKVAQDIADLQYKRAQTAKMYADAAETKRGTETSKKLANLDPESPTFTLDSIRASTGGKIATGDQTKPINKALLVVSQLDSLQSQLAGIDTGPIVGILRGANPYDVKAQLLKATLQATVPNLARGVYGEVGVLTDNDIANYVKTLPNIKSTKELSDLVLSMTLKVVKNSVDSNLQVLAAEGRDVSGFEGIYKRLESKTKEIDGRIGITGGGAKTGKLSDGTVVTQNADGSITDSKGNKYDADGNKIK